MNTNAPPRRRKSTAKKPLVQVVETEIEQSVVPYDKYLLERARTQWQFGDWQSLADLDRNAVQHHPDRARLALLAAAGQLQTDNLGQARQFIRLALDWGCGKKLVAQILAAGVYNSLARVAAIAGNQSRAVKHFESAILVGAPGSDARLIAQARINHQYKLLGLLSNATTSGQGVPDENAITATYQATLNLRFNNASTIALGLNTPNGSLIDVRGDGLEYRTDKGAPLYLVSNENGNFEKPPKKSQIPVKADTTYLLSGELFHKGETNPVIWIFQYADGKKIASQAIATESGRFRHNFRTLPATESLALAIRLAGIGTLELKNSVIRLQEPTAEDLSAYFEEKLEKIKQAQKHDVENSMKQIEACIRLQHYLGPDTLLPDMHNWPISPDFGVLLINLVEQHRYDAVIEFGSGTSTLILAKALERVARRDNGTPSPLLSFDHLAQYRDKTQMALKQAGLESQTSVVLAELTPWQDESGNAFSYYACAEALQALKLQISAPAPKLLIVVDGPPAATGKHARYPALPCFLAVFGGEVSCHVLMDDYLRSDEQEIVARWVSELTTRHITNNQTKFSNLEKKACLLELNP